MSLVDVVREKQEALRVRDLAQFSSRLLKIHASSD